jgi:cellulose synthase (UDP-forming)
VAGWAYVFTFWDVLRGRRKGWQATGSGKGQQDGGRRFWTGLIGWSATTCVLWTGAAFWRMITMDPYNFILMFILGLSELVIVSRILIQPRAGAAT